MVEGGQLGRRLEGTGSKPALALGCTPPTPPQILRPARLAGLAGLAGPPQQALHHARLPEGMAAAADAQRLARYALRRCEAVAGLLRRLATVPELVELARACGLTLLQVRAPGCAWGCGGAGGQARAGMDEVAGRSPCAWGARSPP